MIAQTPMRRLESSVLNQTFHSSNDGIIKIIEKDSKLVRVKGNIICPSCDEPLVPNAAAKIFPLSVSREGFYKADESQPEKDQCHQPEEYHQIEKLYPTEELYLQLSTPELRS